MADTPSAEELAARLNAGSYCYQCGYKGGALSDEQIASEIRAACRAKWNDAIEECARWHDGEARRLHTIEIGCGIREMERADKLRSRRIDHEASAHRLRALKREDGDE